MSTPSTSTPSMSPPPRPGPPHIRLNSGQEDLVPTGAVSNRPGPSRQTSSRSLIPQQRPPTGPPLRQALSKGVYSSTPAESAELLLPPTRSRTHRFRDEESPGPLQSPDTPGFNSRRTSWSSDGHARDSRAFGHDPFEDSRTPSRAGSDDENVNTQTVSEKYNILPSAGLLLFPEDIEKDDWLHNPDPNEKENRECDIFTKRGCVNVGGLVFITLGVLCLFIGGPVIAFAKKLAHPPDGCNDNPLCIKLGHTIPLLKNVRTGLIDPDTPTSALTKTAEDGTKLKLVFSDEFNKPGRTFYPDDDPYFQGVDLWYGVTQDLEWYDPDAATTGNGTLELRFDAFQNHGLNYRSAMLQSWNQMCFTGGRLEASISLPGRGDTIGFWPGFWAMGNLGRPGYASTTDGLWPYSYWDKCDAGITKNQSTADGLSFLPGMRLPACTCSGEDHPTPGKSRSAPEIDVIEASVGFLGPGEVNGIGSASQSAQFAPFDIWYQPDYDYLEIYDPSVTAMNSYRGGVFQQALSGVTNLNNHWYDGKAYQNYAFEYVPGGDGKIVWFVGDTKTWKMDARAVRPNGNIGQRVVPTEPMAIVMNFGMSASFAELNLTGINPLLPATMRFDYVRIYQDPSSESSVTCDPPSYDTTTYISSHKNPYYNANLTTWEHTGHGWPKNSLVDQCSM